MVVFRNFSAVERDVYGYINLRDNRSYQVDYPETFASIDEILSAASELPVYCVFESRCCAYEILKRIEMSPYLDVYEHHELPIIALPRYELEFMFTDGVWKCVQFSKSCPEELASFLPMFTEYLLLEQIDKTFKDCSIKMILPDPCVKKSAVMLFVRPDNVDCIVNYFIYDFHP